MITQTILKTLSYGTMHVCVSILVAYILSGDWAIALAIGTVEPCVQTIAFFFHERAWHLYEKKSYQKDYHDSVIDSVSPAGDAIEHLLHQKD